jgi:surface polysaccharide O-acyltransferase-like enzyme
MFIVGIVAYRGNWFTELTDSSGKVWQIVTAILLLSLPVMFLFGGARGGIDSFLGGLNWQALFYALWEQFVCAGMVTGLSVLFRKSFNQQGSFAKTLSASAYTVFIFHAPILVFLALALKGISLYPLIKFVLVAPLAVSLCFALATIIRKLPLTRKIL